ncbi:hypothetical protein GMORB2_7516 [Geosmithia morbida]|uniref:Uncharacterized protein n=1 Tax=Geosmithia morbida TaxID=1094350 RepID=A0A9P5D5I4_9HYPO|nr:uncharacterized protein GMORB2_7516 [Geosmithia morbida]KAF4122524.1 hypothetical protein GMORB2_7516 [Geosmithia morbida]
MPPAHCIAQGPRNTILDLRLVCRTFNVALKPFACRTVGIDFSRLSRTSGRERPQMEALQTIGYHCKSVYVDLMVLRDDHFLNTVFKRVPSMLEFCQTLQTRYCMNESSFTEVDYYAAASDVLFNCRDVERLRLNLPFQLVGRHCTAAILILANTFKAFANRPEEDSAPLKVLVLENLPDIAVCHLGMNPIDLKNMIKVLGPLEHLVMTLRRHGMDPQWSGLFASCLWNMVGNAERLESLCIVGMDHDDRPPRGLRQTRPEDLAAANWRARTLPPPQVMLSNLRCLELKRVEVLPGVLLRAAENFGPTLRELYLNEVYLKVEQSALWNRHSDRVLWVGLPNQRPPDDSRWIAMELRCSAPNLRVCRASFLAYDHYLGAGLDAAAAAAAAAAAPADNTALILHPQTQQNGRRPDFDFADPSGLGRSISQRFVEVVMGIRQPPSPSGEPVDFLPASPSHDHLVTTGLRPRTRPPTVTEYDTNAYQTAVENTTSRWLTKGLDGVFPNCNAATLDRLHYIAETACQGMNEIHRRRSEWPAAAVSAAAAPGNTVADEYTDNLGDEEADFSDSMLTIPGMGEWGL